MKDRSTKAEANRFARRSKRMRQRNRVRWGGRWVRGRQFDLEMRRMGPFKPENLFRAYARVYIVGPIIDAAMHELGFRQRPSRWAL